MYTDDLYTIDLPDDKYKVYPSNDKSTWVIENNQYTISKVGKPVLNN